MERRRQETGIREIRRKIVRAAVCLIFTAMVTAGETSVKEILAAPTEKSGYLVPDGDIRDKAEGSPEKKAERETENRRVYDQAGLFSEEEQQKLDQDIRSLQKTLDMDVALVTTRDAEGKTAEQYADDFYDRNGLGKGEDYSGVLFLMDMDNRELYISTCGRMIRILTDERIGSMLDSAVSYMADQDYTGCAIKLFEDTRHWYEKGIEEGQYNADRDTGEVSPYEGGRKRSIRWYEWLLAFGVSVFCAGGVCRKVKSDYAMEQERKQASGYHMAYRADACFHFRNQSDVLSDSHVTRQVIPRNIHTGHGGGAGHSGRSTTHTAGSGRTHGGGGRKF